jgi:hypothetical protein
MVNETKPSDGVKMSEIHDVVSENYTRYQMNLQSLNNNMYEQFQVYSKNS